MDLIRNNLKFDNFKILVPSIYNSSRDKLSNAISPILKNEAEYLMKTENSDKEILELLISKMELEIILALKFILTYIVMQKDIRVFTTKIIDLASHQNFFIKKLSLYIIDYLGLTKKDEMILLYNSINRGINNSDALSRLIITHYISTLRLQSVNSDCIKYIIPSNDSRFTPLTNDSNPLVRRAALLSLINFIKINNQIVKYDEIINILKKYFNDPHPLVYSTAFYAISDINNKDYAELCIPQKFVYFCENMNKVDDFYFERVIFNMINFTNIFLFNNFEKNKRYILIFFKSLYKLCRYTTNNSKIITCLTAINRIIHEIEKLNLNTISKDELQLFKNNKQLKKLANTILKLLISSKNNIEKFHSLDLINSYIIDKPFFKIIAESLQKHYNLFYLRFQDKEFINSKRLEILVKLADTNNIKSILEEFKRSLFYSNNINKMIITSIYNISKIHNDNIISSICIERLIDLLRLKEENIIAQIIICLRKLIQDIKENTKFVLIYSIKNFKKNITSSLARANIIWMISQYINIIPTVAVDFFRRLLIEIDNESVDVKSQILSFAVRLNAQMKKNKFEFEERINNLIKYAIDKILYDKNYNLREKARIAYFSIKSGSEWVEPNFIENEKVNVSLVENTYTLSLYNKSDLNNKKFIIDQLDENSDPNIYKICLDDIINVSEEVKQNLSGIISVKPSGITTNSIENFDSGINIEEIREGLKNKIDELLNDDDDDEWEVDIKKD